MIKGIHHITALASDPQQNYDFYTRILGMRFVKKTVNFDSPEQYHLYYGNANAEPGSILTFFPFEHMKPGKYGIGQQKATVFSVASSAITYWQKRLKSFDIITTDLKERFGEKYIGFQDPDGLYLELAFHDEDNRAAWDKGEVPAEYGIRGFNAASLNAGRFKETIAFLEQDFFKLEHIGTENNVRRYRFNDSENPAFLDVIDGSEGDFGLSGSGTIHHIAFRVENEEKEEKIREILLDKGVNITPVIDRCYFRSVYFREPSGVLFELATDAPGFDIDEPMDKLGHKLMLPPWLEERREEIENGLKPVS